MNHTQAKQQLFDQAFLIGPWRRGRALKFLLTATDAEAVRILVDAVDRKHPESAAIQQHLAGVSSPDAVTGLTASWAQEHRDWLGPIAVQRALALGCGAALPMDRQTAWLVAPHLGGKGAIASAAEAYAQGTIKAQPAYVQAFLFKTGRGATLELSRANVFGALELLGEKEPQVRSGRS